MESVCWPMLLHFGLKCFQSAVQRPSSCFLSGYLPGPIRKPGSRVFPSSTNPVEFSLAPAGPSDIYCKAIIRALCVKGLGQGLENKWIYTLCSLVCHARLALSWSIGMCVFLLSSAFCLILFTAAFFYSDPFFIFFLFLFFTEPKLLHSSAFCKFKLVWRLLAPCRGVILPQDGPLSWFKWIISKINIYFH